MVSGPVVPEAMDESPIKFDSVAKVTMEESFDKDGIENTIFEVPAPDGKIIL
jgi:hypothetical protein